MTGLLVIDIQNFYEKILADFEKTCANAVKIINNFRERNRPVFYIQHIKKIPVINSLVSLEKIREFQIHESVRPLEDEPVIQKYYINCFRETALLEKMQEKDIKKVVICGMMTHMCVDAAVRAAGDLGFDVQVIGDGCTTKDLSYRGQTVKARDVHNALLAAFKYGYARVTGTKGFLKNNRNRDK